MTLTPAVIKYIQNRAKDISVASPGHDDDLYSNQILDSFEMLSLISVLEKEYGITVPDSSVDPENFRSLRAIESYVRSFS